MSTEHPNPPLTARDTLGPEGPLTPAQVEALHLVAQGAVIRELGKWYQRGYWQALRPQPYRRLLDLDLIRVGERVGFSNVVHLTDAGRETRGPEVSR